MVAAEQQITPVKEPPKFLWVGLWILNTLIYAGVAPFMVLGGVLFIAWLTGTSSGDVREFFAILGTGTPSDFAHYASMLKPFALLISFIVLTVRIVGCQPFMDAAERFIGEKIVARLPDRLRDRHGRKLPVLLLLVFFPAIMLFAYLHEPPKPIDKPVFDPWVQRDARATIVMPDGKTIVSGRAVVDVDAATGRYMVSFKE